MITNSYKTKVSKLVEQAKEKGVVKTYSEFCENKISTQTAISEEEATYYSCTEQNKIKKNTLLEI